MNVTLTVLRNAVTANDAVVGAIDDLNPLLDQLGFNLNASDNYAWLEAAMSDGVAAGIAKLDGLATALRAGFDLPPRPDENALKHVARQSAIKVFLINQNRPLPPPHTPIEFAETEREMIDYLESLWLEGFRYGRQHLGGRRGKSRHRYAS